MMDRWVQYLEAYADNEGNLEAQILVGAQHSAEILGALCLALDREGHFQADIEANTLRLREGLARAVGFEESLAEASAGIYGQMNTLSRQFAQGNNLAHKLIRQVDQQVKMHADSAAAVERSSAYLRASFPLLSLVSLVLAGNKEAANAVRAVEGRFAAAEERVQTQWDSILNAVYRLVEMMQIAVSISDANLRDQVNQIAQRFQEEDQSREFGMKMRNGFCRLFELVHALAMHLEASLEKS